MGDDQNGHAEKEPAIVGFMAPIIETLGRDDDLVAVLRGQLHIEALLARVLTSKYPDTASHNSH